MAVTVDDAFEEEEEETAEELLEAATLAAPLLVGAAGCVEFDVDPMVLASGVAAAGATSFHWLSTSFFT